MNTGTSVVKSREEIEEIKTEEMESEQIVNRSGGRPAGLAGVVAPRRPMAAIIRCLRLS